jgi:glucose-fructose oxidoreductase
MKTWRIVGINFDHMHMGDLLRLAHEHPNAEIAGICDEDRSRMEGTIANFGIQYDRVFTDYRTCLETAKPDLVILCPATGEHANWTEKVAPYGAAVLVEKPFAASLEDADRMIAAMKASGKPLAINWPLRWYPTYITTYRLIREGAIGQVKEVHHYGGNRGPLYHRADKVEHEPTPEEKSSAWWYKKASGGGSLLDYIGYGVTLGTWFHGNRKPIEVTTAVDCPDGLEVDEHSVTVARYQTGLSKFETRWGTFTDPWVAQPQPKCGFVITGTEGTISSYDYDETIRLQTRTDPVGTDLPVDTVEAPMQNPIQYMIHILENDGVIDGPLSPEVCRIAQQIVDSALLSAAEKRTVPLVDR